MLSCQDNLEAAKKLAVDSGNALACFHVAKQLEYAEQVQPVFSFAVLDASALIATCGFNFKHFDAHSRWLPPLSSLAVPASSITQ